MLPLFLLATHFLNYWFLLCLSLFLLLFLLIFPLLFFILLGFLLYDFPATLTTSSPLLLGSLFSIFCCFSLGFLLCFGAIRNLSLKLLLKCSEVDFWTLSLWFLSLC